MLVVWWVHGWFVGVCGRFLPRVWWVWFACRCGFSDLLHFCGLVWLCGWVCGCVSGLDWYLWCLGWCFCVGFGAAGCVCGVII